jgi:predicted dehydrogenase
MSKYGVAILGCGNIAGAYASDMQTYPELNLLGAADVDAARAGEFAAKYNIKAYESNEAVLADPAVQIVVNLTSHFAHHELNIKALNAGKHVFTEKPMAVSTAEAYEQVQLAKAKGLRLAAAPFTLMGEAQQTAWKYIRDGKLGTVRVVYAEVNWGRIEAWHPAPGPFYEVGALFDVGVYPLTILTAMFGPVKRVISYGTLLYPHRVTKEGVPFTISTPDWVNTNLETESGTVIRLTTDFYVSGQNSKQTGIEFHGDTGSIYLDNWHDFDGRIYYAKFGESLQEIQPIRTPAKGVPRGRGMQELAQAISENRPHRFDGEQAWHVVDILNSAVVSMKENRPVELTSRFTPPPPMEWAT